MKQIQWKQWKKILKKTKTFQKLKSNEQNFEESQPTPTNKKIIRTEKTMNLLIFNMYIPLNQSFKFWFVKKYRQETWNAD